MAGVQEMDPAILVSPQQQQTLCNYSEVLGSGCGRTSLVPDSVLLAGIRRGDTIILETAYTI